MQQVIIRSVQESDINALAALEARVWQRHNTPILSQDELYEWYSEKSPYFLVAEYEGTVCGYYFGRQIAFAPDRIDAFLNPSQVSGKGYSLHRHDPAHDSVYGISVASEVPGVGGQLNAAVHQLLEVMGIRYFVGFTRLSRLRAYVEKVETLHGGVLPYSLNDLVLWYAHESAELLRMPVWKEAKPKPTLSLPRLRRPDPVLAFHVRGTNFGLLTVLPNYMPDPASKNYGAFIASAAPHHR